MKKRFETLRMRWVIVLVFALLVLGIVFFTELRSLNLEPRIGEFSCDNLEGDAKCNCLDLAEKEMRETINKNKCESENQCKELRELVSSWIDLLEEIRTQCG